LSYFPIEYPGNDNRLIPIGRGVDSLNNCQFYTAQYIAKLDLANQGLEIEFHNDLMISGHELNFTVTKWFAREVITEDENKKIRQTINLVRKTGHLSVPLKTTVNSMSPTDIVAVIVAAVVGVTTTVAKAYQHQHQQLMFVKEPEVKRQSQQQQLVEPELLQPPASLIKDVPELGKLAAIDCEWSDNSIYCFCSISPYGESVKLHVKRCKNESEFVTKILDTIGKYDLLAGHNIRGYNSDIDQIQKMCWKSGLEGRFYEILKTLKSIDTWKIFSNKVMKGTLAQRGIDYATHKLEDIAMAYIGEGKKDGLTGASIESLPIETQLNYCLKDCELVRLQNFKIRA
jgi:hypothetical protein